MSKKLFPKVITVIALCCSFVCVNAQVIYDPTKPDSTKQTGTKIEGQKANEQNDDKPKKCIKKFKSLTDTYYGYPAVFGYIMQLFVDHNTNLSMIGPTGGKYEFLLTDKFGIGTDVNYTTSSISWLETKTDVNGKNISYNHNFSSTAFRSMATFNFHFHTRKKVDWYTSLKGGYYGRTYKYVSDDPTSKPPKIDQIWVSNDWHVAFRYEFGVRIFLAPFLALNFQMGIGGGPIFASGISSKF